MLSPIGFFREVVSETKKVTWPSKQQTQNMTILVIVVSCLVGLYIGLLDFIFQKVMTSIL